MKLTLSDAKAQLREVGITLSHHDGEYRVNFRNGKDETAYFTNSLLDALETGRALAETRPVLRLGSTMRSVDFDPATRWSSYRSGEEMARERFLDRE